ncbi:hypothetical protein SDDV_ORF065 [Scale drop disease virus]|nr:hypothetical protein SDDV_ORF065 [Scale drop disease virus]
MQQMYELIVALKDKQYDHVNNYCIDRVDKCIGRLPQLKKGKRRYRKHFSSIKLMDFKYVDPIKVIKKICFQYNCLCHHLMVNHVVEWINNNNVSILDVLVSQNVQFKHTSSDIMWEKVTVSSPYFSKLTQSRDYNNIWRMDEFCPKTMKQQYACISRIIAHNSGWQFFKKDCLQSLALRNIPQHQAYDKRIYRVVINSRSTTFLKTKFE